MLDHICWRVSRALFALAFARDHEHLLLGGLLLVGGRAVIAAVLVVAALGHLDGAQVGDKIMAFLICSSRTDCTVFTAHHINFLIVVIVGRIFNAAVRPTNWIVAQRLRTDHQAELEVLLDGQLQGGDRRRAARHASVARQALALLRQEKVVVVRKRVPVEEGVELDERLARRLCQLGGKRDRLVEVARVPASIGVLACADEGRVADRDLELAFGALERRPSLMLDILVAAAG